MSSKHQIGPFDTVFANSVLCRHPHDTQTYEEFVSLFRLELFEDLVGEIDSVLRPGGVLQMVNTNYYFGDTKIFPRYSVMSEACKQGWVVPVMDLRLKVLQGKLLPCVNEMLGRFLAASNPRLFSTVVLLIFFFISN